jgi:cyclic beta-1,2-glucan synthetase
VRRIPGAKRAALESCEQRINARIAEAGNEPGRWKEATDELAGPLWHDIENAVHETIATSDAISTELLSEIRMWLGMLHRQVHALQRDVGSHFPWAVLLANPPEQFAEHARDIARRLSPRKRMPELIEGATRVLVEIGQLSADAATSQEGHAWLADLGRAVEEGIAKHGDLARDLGALAERCDALAYGMDFAFLYDAEARLFVIGYNHSVGRMDRNHYDLLATEARLASYFAIAKHDAPVEHWFALGRPITRLGGNPSILSWSGSMFEYLMPALFLPGRRDTLLGESETTAVEYQRRYATERGIPWGISESAYGLTDAGGDYQYRAFGVPGLGIKRGLSDDLVVAPYATALALCVRPEAAALNLEALEKLGALGAFGFIDALDFTPGRLSGPHRFVPVRTYMAHHQGMTLVAIANVLLGDIQVRRAMREQAFQAMDLLLHERVPWDAPIEKGRIDEAWEVHTEDHAPDVPPPWVPSADAAVPQIHMLGNGRMSARISESGAGGLFWQGDALTRWRPDPTRDCDGIWIYVRDGARPPLWSVGRQPTPAGGPEGKTVFHQHMVETFRRHDDIAARMEVTIAPFDDVEIRKATVTNESDATRVIDIVSYAEVVLATPQEDERHQAFSKLFVGSAFLPDHGALVFERRPRRPETRSPVLLHSLVTKGPDLNVHAFETDRSRFIGRDGSAKDPQGLRDGLSGTTGWTLDPILALQVRLRLKPAETRTFAFLTVAGASRGDVLDTASRYPFQALERTFRDAELDAAREVRRLEIEPSRLPQLQAMSSLLLQPVATLRSVPATVTGVRQGQPGLWRFDLVILHTGQSGYEGPLRERILSVLRDAGSESFLGRNGGIRLLSADQMDTEARAGLQAAAHVVLGQDATELAELLDRMLEGRFSAPPFTPIGGVGFDMRQPLPRPSPLEFDNGLGGFDPDTGDYVIHLAPNANTPAPWCNVLSNDDFGTIVSESGLGFTWAVNSGENRLTPWSNDPVADEPGEVLYLRDEATAEIWTPTPAPLGHAAECQIRHGRGYTRWTRNSMELEQELVALVPTDSPVKLVRLRLTNRSDQNRRLTATYYAEWLLGAMRSAAKPHIVTVYDPELTAIVARNGWNPEFGDRIAFLTATLEPHSLTGDRHDFLGKEGGVADPAALRRWDLGGRFVPGGDACAGYQVHLDIGPRQTAEVVFALGQAPDLASAGEVIAKWRDPGAFDGAFHEVAAFWETRLGAVQVRTPDPAFDLMVNRWLPYQNIACRLMARAGFYQAGGAFGFRDQLQDVLAVLFSDPARARAQILRAAARQFESGDALHWWHPPSGRGVRTRCSDDYLWLAYVTARYVDVTGDADILKIEIPFLTGAELEPGEHDRYALFDTGPSASLFEHCARALDRMVAVGSHGLPLIGTGDWNDGMDRVGDEGRGESVWLAWFEIATTGLFSPLADAAGEGGRADRWRRHAEAVRGAIHDVAWDGAWFLRAFDDEGEPWGSKYNDECRIDLIAQAWSVLSGDAPDARARQAMESALQHLVDPDERLIRLLMPPFHRTLRDPGYIQAYPAGIRENGGQYTHAAAWLGLAFTGLGDGDRAWEVFDIINPIRRASTPEAAATYLREPYVLPGDVSGGAHAGKGGWSWYTGAAGWTWQLAVHGILGIEVMPDAIRISPCLPRDWARAEIRLVGPLGEVLISIEDPDRIGKGRTEITVDGAPAQGDTVRFPGAGKSRKASVRLVRPAQGHRDQAE